MYYVEIPATWVDEELRAVAEEQLVETCDLFGLPEITVRWIRGVGTRSDDARIPWQESNTAFIAMGKRPYYPTSGHCAKRVLGIVTPEEPRAMRLRSDPEAYRPRRRRVYHETEFPRTTYPDWQSQARGIVVHECVHCLQHATGIWELTDHYQQERMAYTMQADYPSIVRRMLLKRETHPNATFATAPLWATEATDYESVLRGLTIRGEAGVYARYHDWLAEAQERSEQSA